MNTLRLRILLLAIAAIAVGIYNYDALYKLAYAVIHREGSSHGIFVPFISAFFIWTKRDTLSKTELRRNVYGIPIMAIALISGFIGFGTYELRIIEFIIFIAGAVLFLFGGKFFKEIAFPLIFLITLVPIPDDIYVQIAECIRIISFGGARFIISILGIPFLREGKFIYFHNASLEVAIACSGIRYLVSYFVFSLAYAYLFKSAPWSRIAVVVSSFFISLFASVMRLTSIFVLTYYVSPKMAETRPHIIISWCVFFVVLFVAIYLDQKFMDARRKGSEEVGRH